MKTILAALALATLASAAGAQVVYEPVRYQYGRYNEVFYGGRNPGFTNNAYIYLPPALQVPYSAQRLNTPPFLNGYTVPGANGSFVSPYSPYMSNTNPNATPLVFSDYLPYQEVGQFGYTADDARNEAYANVPRVQAGIVRPGAPAAKNTQPNSTVASAPPTDPRVKAIPLLNWAKVERVKNPELYKALMDEARKLDPAATANLERATASEK